jgi:PST family polysaccharide transporter/lipopolysaccharide exporter
MLDYSTNEMTRLARLLVTGVGYRAGSFLLMRLIQIARIIIFARLFSPADIGIASLAVGCVSIMSLFANLGFSQSVIRKQGNSLDFTNTVFTLSLVFGIFVFILTLILAPLLSDVFSADLDTYIRFLAIIVLSVPVRFPSFLWEKELQFRHPSIVPLIGEGISFLTAIALEFFYRMGVWSLLIGNSAGFLLSGIYIWIFAIYRPKLQIVRGHIKPLLNFGAPLMIQGINGEAMSRGDNLMVGAYAGATQLAYYNFAWQLPMLISSFTQVVDSMLFPVYARIAEDRQAMRRLFNITNKLWSITGSFLGFAMLIFADRIIFVIYGPTWNPVVPILRVMSISFIIRFCTGYAYDNLAIVYGRTKYLMKWGIVNSILIFTVGQYMIAKIGSIGGAWFWMAQAIILIPLIRLPLIHQELGTFEFMNHVWQPFISGILASLISFLSMIMLPHTGWIEAIYSALIYIFSYMLLLLFLDRQLRSDLVKMSALISNRSEISERL